MLTRHCCRENPILPLAAPPSNNRAIQSLNSRHDDRPWVVVKFGGSSVSTRTRWKSILDIVCRHRESDRRVLIVVSALSGVTDLLKSITDSPASTESVDRVLAEITARHRQLAHDMELSDTTDLNRWLDSVRVVAHATGETDRSMAWQAELLAHGELLSSALGAAFLKADGLDAHWLDSRRYLVAEALPNQSEWSNWLCASISDRSFDNTMATLPAGEVFIAQGFIAGNATGETVVLGRGGSDTSAAAFGALLDAEAVEIWTDVPGMFTANPRQVPDARLLARLDYAEAQEIATTGAKVLHPRCIHPARERRIPLLIRDTNHPQLPGTMIAAETAQTAPSVKAISSRRGITLVSMESIGMWQQVGFLAGVFEVFRRHGLSVDLIGSAETNVTVSLDPSDNLLTTDVLARLCEDLVASCRVKVIAPCAAITLVGRGMRSMLHRLSGVLAEFGALDVHLISQSSNNLNLTFVVDEALVDSLIPRLHEMLIHAEAMRVDDARIFGRSWRELVGEQVLADPKWWRLRRQELLDVAETGTPTYVYNLDDVSRQANHLKAIESVDRWHYALKANPHPDILRRLNCDGFAFECVSLEEVRHVLASVPGLAANHVLFTPNFAPREEYRVALSLGVNVTVDALHPLREWGEDFRGRELFLRVDLGHGRGHHEKVRTGGKESKFGVSMNDLAAVRELARRYDTRIVGLHAHLGSGVREAGHWRGVYAQLASIAEQFDSVRILDIGGGLGVPSRPGEQALDVECLSSVLTEVRAVYPQFTLWMEPGRYLVAEAGVLLAQVTQIKRKSDVDYVGIDAGMNSLLRPALYDAWHEIVNLSRIDDEATELVQVVGPICESGDTIGHNRRLPVCKEGDVILIAEAGAYGAVMSSHYNLRQPAREVVL